VHESLLTFDQETQAMGGSYASAPCPGLLRNTYDFQHQIAERDGWL